MQRKLSIAGHNSQLYIHSKGSHSIKSASVRLGDRVPPYACRFWPPRLPKVIALRYTRVTSEVKLVHACFMLPDIRSLPITYLSLHHLMVKTLVIDSVECSGHDLVFATTPLAHCGPRVMLSIPTTHDHHIAPFPASHASSSASRFKEQVVKPGKAASKSRMQS